MGSAEEYLSQRGLTMEDASDLGFEVLTPDQTALLSPSLMCRASIKIPYFNPDGTPMHDWPGCPPYFRVRYLGSPPPGPAQLVKERRYAQVKGTVPCAYYPRNFDWSTVLDDPEAPLIITEGEIKAAKACKEGFSTIAIGGVDGIKSTKHGVLWLESLGFPKWQRRKVYIAFDSDVSRKHEVARALKSLCEALEVRGAYVYMLYLPDLPGNDKVGLDDYLVIEGADKLVELASTAEPLGFSRILWQFNERFVYIRNPQMVYCKNTGDKVKVAAFTGHLESTKKYQEATIAADGTIKRRPANAATSWINWPCRAEATKLVCAPGRGPIVDGAVNVWKGWGAQPVEGNVELFVQLIDHLFSGAPEQDKSWFMRWLAYPIQHPGSKLYTAVVFWSAEGGEGKSLLAATMRGVYGESYHQLQDGDLGGQWTWWAEGRQFVSGDDISSHDSRKRSADQLKGMITRETVTINSKNVPQYTVADRVNYFFTSNQPDAFFIDEKDRRYFVHHLTCGALPDEFYTRYDKWYKHEDNTLVESTASAIHYYLKNYPLGDFNPRARAPLTRAKELMISSGRSDISTWCVALLSDPDCGLRVGDVRLNCDLYTSTQLLELYNGGERSQVKAGGVGIALQKLGVTQVEDGAALRIPGQPRARYFIIRNIEKWKDATHAEIVAHIVENTPENKVRRF